jgi:hypothetical protein
MGGGKRSTREDQNIYSSSILNSLTKEISRVKFDFQFLPPRKYTSSPLQKIIS